MGLTPTFNTVASSEIRDMFEVASSEIRDMFEVASSELRYMFEVHNRDKRGNRVSNPRHSASSLTTYYSGTLIMMRDRERERRKIVSMNVAEMVSLPNGDQEVMGSTPYIEHSGI